MAGRPNNHLAFSSYIFPGSPFLSGNASARQNPPSDGGEFSNSQPGPLTLPPINYFREEVDEPDDDTSYFESFPRSPWASSLLPARTGSTSASRPNPPLLNQQNLEQTNLISSDFRDVTGLLDDFPSSSSDLFDPLSDTDLLEFYNRTPSPTSRSFNQTPGVIDLTESPTLSMPPKKRKTAPTAAGNKSKVPRKTTAGKTPTLRPSSSSSGADGAPEEAVETVDLVDVEDEAACAAKLAKLKAEKLKQQQMESAKKPIKLSEFQCIICMDSPKDLTVTHCGHLFCSECLHQALHVSNTRKACPVCRQSISTTLTGKGEIKKQPRNGVFALEMKLMTKSRKEKQPA